MSRDTHQSATYLAEEYAFAGTLAEVPLGLDRIAAAGAQLCATDWWRAGARNPQVTIVAARADAQHSKLICGTGGTATMRVADHMTTLATLVHELAHAWVGGGHGHDDLFRGASIALCEVALGEDYASQLREGYARCKLAVSPVDVGSRARGVLLRHLAEGVPQRRLRG